MKEVAGAIISLGGMAGYLGTLFVDNPMAKNGLSGWYYILPIFVLFVGLGIVVNSKGETNAEEKNTD